MRASIEYPFTGIVSREDWAFVGMRSKPQVISYGCNNRRINISFLRDFPSNGKEFHLRNFYLWKVGGASEKLKTQSQPKICPLFRQNIQNPYRDTIPTHSRK